MPFFVSVNFLIPWILLLACSFQLLASDDSPQLHRSRPQSHLSSDDLTTFPSKGDLNLVLEDKDNFEFEMCCPTGTCMGSVSYCFSTTKKDQHEPLLFGCDEAACAYNLEFKGIGEYVLNGGGFSTSDKCLTGILKGGHIYTRFATSSTPENAKGCPLKVDAGNLFKLYIKSIPEGVTVTAKNAKKYVEPTTPAQHLDRPAEEASQNAKEGGISSTLLALVIGLGILIVVLIIAIIAAAVYCCYSKRKNAKNPKPVDVIKVKGPKPATEVQPEKPTLPKPKAPKVAEGEKEVKSKAPPVAPSDEPPASKEPIAPSAEPRQASRERAPSAEPAQTSKPMVEPKPYRKEHVGCPPHITEADYVATIIYGRDADLRRPFKRNDTFEKVRKADIESATESLVRHQMISEKDAPRFIVEKPRTASFDEIKLFSRPIGDMLPMLETMIDEAQERHDRQKEEHTGKQCKVINKLVVSYMTCHYAFVVHYRQYFKPAANLGGYSIPLLFAFAMDRKLPVDVRRRALVQMTTKAISLEHEFSPIQRLHLPFPISVMFDSYKFDNYLVCNVDRLHTFSSPNNSEECSRKSEEKKKNTAGATTIAESVTSVNDCPSKENVEAAAPLGDGKQK